MKRIHYFSGLLITLFILLHLFNHFFSFFGATAHIEVMDSLRIFYRNDIFEATLILAIGIQIFSGIQLFVKKRKLTFTFFEKLQIWSGLYLALFFIIHLSAIFLGRYLLELDTNYYFGVAGLNTFPYNLFFIPYYGLAIIAFSGHVASVHNQKMKENFLNLTPLNQSKFILLFGICLTVLLLFGLTNQFEGVALPSKYNVLIGK